MRCGFVVVVAVVAVVAAAAVGSSHHSLFFVFPLVCQSKSCESRFNELQGKLRRRLYQQARVIAIQEEDFCHSMCVCE